jgi:hypothetical protein
MMFPLAVSPIGGVIDDPMTDDQQRSKAAPRLPSQLRIRHLAITNPEPPRLAQRPSPAPKSKMGEAAKVHRLFGQPAAPARDLWIPPGNSPSRITAAAGSAAIIRQAQELSRFDEPLSARWLRLRNTKTPHRCAEPVDDETSLWKSEENQG